PDRARMAPRPSDTRRKRCLHRSFPPRPPRTLSRLPEGMSPKAYDQPPPEPLPQPALSASPRPWRPRALTEYEREQSRLWGLQQIRSEPILRRLMWGLLELTELLIAHMGDRF